MVCLCEWVRYIDFSGMGFSTNDVRFMQSFGMADAASSSEKQTRQRKNRGSEASAGKRGILKWVCLKMVSTPLYPMVLLIIIPFWKMAIINWEYLILTQHFQTNPNGRHSQYTSLLHCIQLRSAVLGCSWNSKAGKELVHHWKFLCLYDARANANKASSQSSLSKTCTVIFLRVGFLQIAAMKAYAGI